MDDREETKANDPGVADGGTTGEGAPAEAGTAGPGPEGDETLWKKVRKGVVDGYQYAADKTDVYARIAARRLAIVGINRKIDRAYSELGEKVYNLLAGDPKAELAADPAVQELAGRLRTAAEELTTKEAAIVDVRQGDRERSSVKKTED